jgi:nitronate monooxygenase
VALSGSIAHGASVLAAQAMGADFGYIGSAFIATKEANAVDGYKDNIVEAKASDIVYSDLFTGVSGNYLRQSIERAGMDPKNLPKGDISTMNFGSGGNSEAKAWKDIWGSGQGIGAIKEVQTVAQFIDQLEAEYRAAKVALDAAFRG